MTEPAAPPAAAAALPWTLRAAVVALSVEALALAGLTVALIYQDATSEAADLGAALVVTGFTAVYALALGLLARALAHRRGRARGLTIVLQLMLAPVGYFLLTTGLPALGAPLTVLGLAVIGLLLAPPSTRALGLTDGAANG